MKKNYAGKFELVDSQKDTWLPTWLTQKLTFNGVFGRIYVEFESRDCWGFLTKITISYALYTARIDFVEEANSSTSVKSIFDKINEREKKFLLLQKSH